MDQHPERHLAKGRFSKPVAAAGFVVLLGAFFLVLTFLAGGGPVTDVQAEGDKPTKTATSVPTEEPTDTPTVEPTETPTEEPTEEPTATPTEEPILEITVTPTEEPTVEPTIETLAVVEEEEPLPPAAPVEAVSVAEPAAVATTAPVAVAPVTALPSTGSGGDTSTVSNAPWIIASVLVFAGMLGIAVRRRSRG